MRKHLSIVLFALLVIFSFLTGCTTNDRTASIGSQIAGSWSLQSSDPDDGKLFSLNTTFTAGAKTGGTIAISINGGNIQNTVYSMSGNTVITTIKIGGKNMLLTFDDITFVDTNTITFLLLLPPAPNKPVTEYNVTMVRE